MLFVDLEESALDIEISTAGVEFELDESEEGVYHNSGMERTSCYTSIRLERGKLGPDVDSCH